MHIDAIWRSWDETTLEHLSFNLDHEQIIANSVITATNEHTPVCISYRLTCDLEWKIRSLSLLVSHETPQQIYLISDGNGNWTTDKGIEIPELKGCMDIDLSISPFTNIYPIRRLHFPEQTNELPVVYIDVPRLQIVQGKQRYTKVKETGSLTKYRYENLLKGFEKDFWVDEHGLVIDYPGGFRREMEVEIFGSEEYKSY